MSIRALALNAFEQFAAGNIDILKTVIAEDFIEHSPGNPSGRDAFVAFMATSRAAGAKLTLHRVISDDEYVVMHYRMDPPAEPPLAVIDIWRFSDNLIVEHWDVVQPPPGPRRHPQRHVLTDNPLAGPAPPGPIRRLRRSPGGR
jgi:predicted SnoaL-like aldol condensation-catalyzing enzyme